MGSSQSIYSHEQEHALMAKQGANKGLVATYDSVSNLPVSAIFGKGVAQIEGGLYASNGTGYAWNGRRNPKAMIVGDSIVSLANQLYQKTDAGFEIVISNGVATITRNSHGLWEGSPITFSATNDLELDGKPFLIESRVDANSFTVLTPGATDATYNSGTSQSVCVIVLSQHGAGNWAVIANELTGSNLTFVTPIAQPGQRINQINPLLSERIYDETPGTVFYTCGTNDIAQGATYQQVIDRLTESYKICNQALANFVITTLPPQTGASDTIRDIIFSVNNWIRTRNWPNFYVVDWSRLVSDNATVGWGVAPGTSQSLAADALHPSGYAHLLAGKAAAKELPKEIFAFNPLATIANVVADGAGQLLFYDNFTGSTGAASAPFTGTVPTGWTASADAGVTAGTVAIVGSDTTLIPPVFCKNGNFVKLVVTTATSGSARLDRTTAIAASVFNALIGSATPWVEFQVDVIIYGANALQGINAFLQLYDTAYGAMYLQASVNNERKLLSVNDTFDDWQTTSASGLAFTLRSPRVKMVHTIGAGAFCKPRIGFYSGVSGMTVTALISEPRVMAFATQFD